VSKGRINVVHLYPREMSIYGDLGNTRCLASRLRWHGYEAVVSPHHPGEDLPEDAHLLVGYENHSGSTLLGEGQQPFGTVRSGLGNNGNDRTEGAVRGSVFGSYLHGPILPANHAFADALIALAVRRATGREFEPAEVDDSIADQARLRQIRRLAG